MTRIPTLNRLKRDDGGATIIEFAMILPALCVLLIGIFELGYRSYAASVIQGALHDAARMSTVGGVTPAQIDARVRQRLSNFAQHGNVTTATTSYYDFAGVKRPERIVGDTDPVGEYNHGDCFEDANSNSTWDEDRGRAGVGGADDIVRYEVTFTYDSMFPIGGVLGWEDSHTIQANTVLRNQPFAGRNIAIQRIRRNNDGNMVAC